MDMLTWETASKSLGVFPSHSRDAHSQAQTFRWVAQRAVGTWKHLKTVHLKAIRREKQKDHLWSSLIISSFAMSYCGLHGLQIPRFLSAKSHKSQWHHTRGHAELQDGGLFRTKVNFTETNPQNQKKRLEMFDKFRNFQDIILRHICG